MKIFIDVGTHIGQTLEEVVKPEYGFDLIYGFEPMSREYSEVVKKYPSVIIYNSGLYSQSGFFKLFGDNKNMGASIYSSKNDVSADIFDEAHFIEASTFFKDKISKQDKVIVKINCEGSEIDIMENLIATGEVWKIHNVMIDFDIRKVVGQEHREKELMDAMKRVGFTRFSRCDDVMIGETHQLRIRNWIKSII